MLTQRDIRRIEPGAAPEVGIRGSAAWPYGANICGDTRTRLVRWAHQHGYRLAAPNRPCLHWLTGQKRRCGGLRHPQGPKHPGSLLTTDMRSALDHPTFWTDRDGRPALLLAQPYHVDRDVLDTIEVDWPIDVTVTDESPWYGFTTKGVFLAPRADTR